MNNKKNLIRLSIGLIIFNLFLGGAFFANQSLRQEKYDEQSAIIDQANKDVLGISTNIPQFSTNYIMSNTTFSSSRVFPNVDSIQNYLNKVSSPLSNYEVSGKKASTIIFEASRGASSSQFGVTPNINPGVILAYLEKEQGLLSLRGYDIKTDPENRLKTAMGYGCPDTSKCDREYFGFENQLKWGAYQLQYNYNNANNANFSHVVNKTINTLDGYSVFLSNEATAANYRYTPHAYWGNYNLWKILTANGWGTDSTTWNQDDIDRVNIRKIDTNEGFDTDKIKPEDMVTILNKNFSIGDSGGEIILLQRFLRQQQYFTYGEITGTFGNITKNALENYKKEKGVVNVQNNDSCKSLYGKNWSIGQISDEVKALQECLRKEGTFDYPISTGYFGPVTQASLEKTRSKIGQTVVVPVAPKPTVLTCDDLKSKAWQYGERSEDIKSLQQCLRQVKLFSYPENTGYFGPLTQEALNKWKMPLQNNSVSAIQDCNQIKTQSFTYGEKSERVSILQKCMKDAGIFTWPYITGYFGSVTQESYSKWKGRSVPQIDCEELKKAEWRFAEESDRVKQLQTCMRKAGVFKFSSDTGYFGEVTKQALIKWRGYF